VEGARLGMGLVRGTIGTARRVRRRGPPTPVGRRAATASQNHLQERASTTTDLKEVILRLRREHVHQHHEIGAVVEGIPVDFPGPSAGGPASDPVRQPVTECGWRHRGEQPRQDLAGEPAGEVVLIREQTSPSAMFQGQARCARDLVEPQVDFRHRVGLPRRRPPLKRNPYSRLPGGYTANLDRAVHHTSAGPLRERQTLPGQPCAKFLHDRGERRGRRKGQIAACPQRHVIRAPFGAPFSTVSRATWPSHSAASSIP